MTESEKVRACYKRQHRNREACAKTDCEACKFNVSIDVFDAYVHGRMNGRDDTLKEIKSGRN